MARVMAKIEILELKRRVNKMDPLTMKDSLQVLIEVPKTVGALVVTSHQTIAAAAVNNKARELQVLWRPGPLLLKAQRKYAAFFGTRSLQSRSLRPQTLFERAKSLATKPIRVAPQFSPSRVKNLHVKVTRKARKQEWLVSAKAMVAQSKNSGIRPPAPASSIFLTSQWQSIAARRRKDEVDFRHAEATTGLARPPKPVHMPRKRKPITVAFLKKARARMNTRGNSATGDVQEVVQSGKHIFVTSKAQKKTQ